MLTESALSDGKPHVLLQKKDMSVKDLKTWVNALPDSLTLESVGFDWTGSEAVNTRVVRLTVQSGRLRIEGIDDEE